MKRVLKSLGVMAWLGIAAAVALVVWTSIGWAQENGDHKATDLGLFLGTVLLALVTFFLFRSTAELARETHMLAKETVMGAALADQHHLEQLRPMVSMRDLSAITVETGSTVNVVLNGIALRRKALIYRFETTVVNAGGGPAMDVKVRASFEGSRQEWIQIGVLAAGGNTTTKI